MTTAESVGGTAELAGAVAKRRNTNVPKRGALQATDDQTDDVYLFEEFDGDAV
jgi:hypothetical protein